MSISLPYCVDPHPHRTNWAIWGSDGMTICHVTDRGGETTELAEFVARACNTHGDLVEALRSVQRFCPSDVADGIDDLLSSACGLPLAEGK